MYFFIFALLVLRWFCYFAKWVSKEREASLDKLKGYTIKRLKVLPIHIPILDGLYFCYKIRKHGMSAISEFSKGFSSNIIYEFPLPFKPFKCLISNDATVSGKILNSSDPGHLSRPKVIFNLIYVQILSEGIFGTSYEKWIHQRKIISRAFTTNCLKYYLEAMNRQSKKLIKTLSNLITDNNDNGAFGGQKLAESIDLAILKITLEFVIGSDVEIIESKEAVQLSQDLWEFKDILMHRVLRPECYVPLVWWLHPKRKRAQVLTGRMYAFVRQVIKHYQKKLNEDNGNVENCDKIPRQSLVEVMIKHGATPEEIYHEIGTFLVAGHETITAGFNILLHHLACHPQYQSRCRTEIDRVLGPISCVEDDNNRHLDVDSLSKLEYLERVICESLRLTPAAPFAIREISSPLKIDDKCTLQKGQIMLISSWIVHRNPKYYPNPEIFNPDRFLPEEVQKRGPGTFLPFVSGYRNCVGRRFAMYELKTLAAWFLRNFEVLTTDGLHDVKLQFEITLKPERPYQTKLKMRNDINVRN